jgi:hypothetical protein
LGKLEDRLARRVQVQVTDAILDSAARVVLGLESPDRLPRIAAEALGAGCDSPMLRTLAGMSDSRAEELVPMFEQVLKDLGLSKPSRRDAVHRLAQETARQILCGALSPYAGSKRIWELTLLNPDEAVASLDPFIYAASEWEERPHERHFFETSIIQAAEELVRDE